MSTTPNTPYPVVGELFGSDLVGIIPQPVLQPGGPGTPVTQPTQTIGSLNGQWFNPCGHSVNNL